MICVCYSFWSSGWFEGSPGPGLAGLGLGRWGFSALGGEIVALRRFAGRKVLCLDWRFAGGRFFEALSGRTVLSRLAGISRVGRA